MPVWRCRCRLSEALRWKKLSGNDRQKETLRKLISEEALVRVKPRARSPRLYEMSYVSWGIYDQESIRQEKTTDLVAVMFLHHAGTDCCHSSDTMSVILVRQTLSLQAEGRDPIKKQRR